MSYYHNRELLLFELSSYLMFLQPFALFLKICNNRNTNNKIIFGQLIVTVLLKIFLLEHPKYFRLKKTHLFEFLNML
jgi:hypothetical protein